MEPPAKPTPELTGWKEIATYLRISPRTAQNLELKGLPIHRMPGPKGRIWATAAELDAWKLVNDGSVTRRPAPAPDIESSGPSPEPPPSQPDRRTWLRYGLTAASALGLTGIGLALVNRRLKQNTPVTALRVEGTALIALDSKGVELWSHAFANGIALERYPSNAFSGPPNCLIADADGDGRADVLFQHISAAANDIGRLVCFDASGKLMWQFLPGKSVTDNVGRTFTRPYSLSVFQVLSRRKPATPRVIVVSIHYFSFPAQVAVLDGKTGKLISEYWHRGHLKQMAIADLDGDGEPEVVLAGVNDAPEHKQATLVVLDHRNVCGASCNPKGEPYFQGMARGKEEDSLLSANRRQRRSGIQPGHFLKGPIRPDTGHGR